MKKVMGVILLIVLLFAGCDLGTGNTDNNPEPEIPNNTVSTDYSLWFADIYNELLTRAISEDRLTDMGQIANRQYVCTAINAKWGTSFQPASETASQAANCEYLLETIDRANDNLTSYGTGSYAALQVIDTIAVDDAINRLWKPAGKFVAVSQGDSVACSTDGINWTANTLPGSGYWKVACGNGKFVAIIESYAGASAYSTDGINWTANTLPNSAYSWKDIIYANDKFVAIGYNRFAYSIDGINWTLSTLPANADWVSIAYGNGTFVAVAGSGFEVIYSADGISWSKTDLSFTASWSGITYGNGRFVAVANRYDNNATDMSMYSTDGINWTLSTLGKAAYWKLVKYGNCRFIAVADIGFACSTDGINWTAASDSLYVNDITYANGKFVGVANAGAGACSTDGIHWTKTTLPDGLWYSVTCGDYTP